MKLSMGLVALVWSPLIASAQVGQPPVGPPNQGRQGQGQPGMQPGTQPGPRPPGDPLMRFLFPPEMIMAHQREIGLQEAQRTRLVREMSQAQGKFTELQWTLSAENDKLAQLLQGTTVDEGAVTAQLNKLLALEDDLKRTQLLLMVRVKNVLTPEQQAKLAQFRPPNCVPGQGCQPGRGPGGPPQ